MPNQDGPGGSSNSVFATENQVPISANGQRVEANNFQLDGVTAMSQAWGGAAVVTPNQESVKEIRVSSSSYSAEFGRNTGAQIQVVSQNGTNLFHGSAVFKRNTPGLNTVPAVGRSARRKAAAREPAAQPDGGERRGPDQAGQPVLLLLVRGHLA